MVQISDYKKQPNPRKRLKNNTIRLKKYATSQLQMKHLETKKRKVRDICATSQFSSRKCKF